MKSIVSRQNPLFKKVAGLVSDVRRHRADNLAVLDGHHLVQTYLERVGSPRMIVLSEKGSCLPETRRLLEQASGVDTVRLDDRLFESISGLVSPAGILALIDVVSPAEPAPGSSHVLLDAVQDPGNVGTIIRTAAAAGIGAVWLGGGCAGSWSSRVLRAAQGAHFSVVVGECPDLKSRIRSGNALVVASVASGGVPPWRLDLRGPVDWLFGNEGRGLAPEMVAAADVKVTVPMAEAAESLNVAAASAVCLFEEVRQKSLYGERK